MWAFGNGLMLGNEGSGQYIEGILSTCISRRAEKL